MTNNDQLKHIANKILVRAGLDTNQQFGSPIVILMLISIVLTAVRILQECNKKRTQDMSLGEKCKAYGDEIKEFSSKRGWFTRMRIKRLLKKEMSPDDYAEYGLRLLEAILDVGENLTDEEVQTLVENAYV